MPEIISNTAEIRSMNKKKIISYLRKHPQETRKRISDAIGLSFATVSNLSAQMITDGILTTVSSEKSLGGRIPGLMSLNPKSCCSLCIDLSNQNSVRVTVLNLLGEAIAEKTLADMTALSYEDLLERCYNAALGLVATTDSAFGSLLGVGLAVPGMMDLRANVLVNSTYEKLEGKAISEDLRRLFRLPCYVGNEANLMALATLIESESGDSLMGKGSLIYLYLDEGLGIGIISGGQLLVGAHGFGGEISHWRLDGHRGFPCHCGRSGCLETELSEGGFRKKLQTDNPDLRPMRWEGFVAAVKAGDRAAMRIVEENGRIIGNLIASLTTLFDPQAYWLGGSVAEIYRQLLPFIRDSAKREGSGYPAVDIPVHCSKDCGKLIRLGCRELIFNAWNP